MTLLRTLILLPMLFLLAQPALAQQSDTAETPPERLVSEDGRMQAVDAAGWPLFDGDGNPIWERTPEEQATELFVDSMKASEGLAPSSTAWQFSVVPGLNQALDLVPDFHEARYNLGLIYLQTNDLEGAIVELEKIVTARKDLTDARSALGLAYERTGRLNDADLVYARGLAEDDDSVDLLNGQARVLLKRGRAADAERAAKAILRINSNSVDAFNTLGLAYLEMGRFETARFVFQKAMALPDAEDPAVLASLKTNLGLVFWRQGKEFLAEAEFNAIAIGSVDASGLVTQPPVDPNNAAARVNLAHIRLVNLDYQGARELLEPAYQQLKGNEIVQLSYAVSLRGTGDYDRAQRIYESLAGSMNSELRDDALLNMGILQGDFLKDYEAALETYSEYIAVRETMGQPVTEEEPVHQYIKEMEKLKRKRDRKREREAAKAAEEAAAPPEPEPEPEPAPAEEPPIADEPTPEPTPVPPADGGATDGGTP
jgi:Flp pilus assembly protein TadD